MVTNSPASRHRPAVAPATLSWQQQQAAAVTDVAVLLQRLGLQPQDLAAPDLAALQAAGGQFALRVPESFIARMRPGDPHDPLLRQVLAVPAEAVAQPGFGPDPLAEAAARRAPGLLHKYQGRALLVTTAACAVHCRYCFRRDYDYAADQAGDDQGRWEQALAVLTQDRSVHEVILSGGDPLSLGNARLQSLLQRLEQLPQLQRLRIHTRSPVVLPDRVDAGLLRLLAARRLPLTVVVHANHPAEIDASVHAALRALRDSGAIVLNQSVLLAGINDSVDALGELSARLHAAGALPYYLFLLDRVQGAAHFEVPAARARELVNALARQLPGYLVPRLVQELPGQPAKTPVDLRLWQGD